jgi:hypothetical protein
MNATTPTTSTQPYYGVQVKYENIVCETTIEIDRSYYWLNKTFIEASYKPAEGEALLMNFPPAVRDVIGLYVSMMEKAANGGGCQ